MFGFFKDTLKKALGKFTKAVDEQSEKIEAPAEEPAKEAKKPLAIPEQPKKVPEQRQAKAAPEKKEPVPQKQVKLAEKPEHLDHHAPEKKAAEARRPTEPVSAPASRPAPTAAVAPAPLPASEIPATHVSENQPEPPVAIDIPEEDLEKEFDEKIEELKEAESALEEAADLPEEKPQKRGFFSKLFGKKKEEVAKPIAERIGEQEEPQREEPARIEPEAEEEEETETIEESESSPEEDEEREDEEQEEPEPEDQEDESEEEAGEPVEEDKTPLFMRPKEESKALKAKPLPKALLEEEKEELPEKKKGFFGKIGEAFTMTQLSEKKFDDLFFDLEVAMLENNVAVEVIDKIKGDLHDRLVDQKIKRSSLESLIAGTLVRSLDDVLSQDSINLLQRAKEKKPLVLMFIGVNGSGKTTNLVKIAKYFTDNGLTAVIAACDTFRAAAIQQLEEHANNVGIRVIKHDYGADPAAVAFDALEHAKAKGIDIVLIDTAGRLHSNTNLMDEMKKINRVAKPDLKIFIGESITGNDCVEQAKEFDKAIGIDGIVLTKADIDEKGGAALSISFVTKKPILFIGTGQSYDDIRPFDKNLVLGNLGLS